MSIFSRYFSSRRRLYWDTAAATPLDPRARQAMQPFLGEIFGNPSSIHQEGRAAFLAKENARRRIATVLAAQPDEIIFTSGGTEGNNLAILGIARTLVEKKVIAKPGHIVTSTIEHHSILEACKQLEAEGWSVSYVPVQANGLIDLEKFAESLRPETALVSVMYVNNEIGTIQPLRELAKIIRAHRKKENSPRLPYFHTDACQAPRFLPLSVASLGVDALTLNGSKIYGPKGSGCLYLKRNTYCEPIIWGGGQERGLRSGTEHMAGLVGLATALEISAAGAEKETASLARLRDQLIDGILKMIPEATLNGSRQERVANNVSVTFTGILAEHLLLELDHHRIACSTGSACTYNTRDESHVILALGKNRKDADSTIRFTLSRDTKPADITHALELLPTIVAKLRKFSLAK